MLRTGMKANALDCKEVQKATLLRYMFCPFVLQAQEVIRTMQSVRPTFKLFRHLTAGWL